MSNPFDDLESDDGRDDEPAVGSVSDSTPETDRRPSAEPTGETDPSESGPSFEYSEVRQKPLYARASEWDAFEKNLRTTIAPKLAEADVVDEETREVHNAVLKLANEEPERVAEILLEERRQSK
ncbi:hypothetical protein [Natrinema gari]|uniref:Uncharacterized protein n=1 Tax=Natrinema gari JCM 14663 TaxID=1230459 RepID=L9ZIL5_9EURY|nr:hypothetical protein [Natrinema gari]ELY85427.1 hypothetical protein C486_00110 [Natrinema gari JCM 14663]